MVQHTCNFTIKMTLNKKKQQTHLAAISPGQPWWASPRWLFLQVKPSESAPDGCFSRSNRVSQHQVAVSPGQTGWVITRWLFLQVSLGEPAPDGCFSRSNRVSQHQMAVSPGQPWWASTRWLFLQVKPGEPAPCRSVENIRHPLSPLLSSLWDYLLFMSFFHFLPVSS